MRLLVAGSGIAGIGAALAGSAAGHEVTLFERDPPAPGGSMEAVFDTWERQGATQLRHSHVFLARLYTLIRDRYPDLLRELLAAGARELKFHDSLPVTLRARYAPRRQDADMTILSCRRTTLEAVMRRYAAKLPGATILTGANVRGLMIEKKRGATPRATGLKVEQDGKLVDYPGDTVIDASGRTTPFPGWLAENGIDVPYEEAPSGIIYYSRHYRLRPGEAEPSRSKWFAPGAADLGYIKYGVFPADNGHFSITLALPESEELLRSRILDGAVFDAICASLPGTAPWTDPARAKPTSRVFAMGNLKNSWRDFAPGGAPLILNFYAIGDASISTNPLYGRGCSLGFVQAHMLIDVLRRTDNEMARAKLFAMKMREEVRPFFDAMVRQDRAASQWSDQLHVAGSLPGPGSRLARSLAEDGIVPAVRGDIGVLRSMMKSLHMLQGPDLWMKRPEVVGSILMWWAIPRPLKARYYPGKLGPKRAEMIALVEGIKPKPRKTAGARRSSAH